MARVSTRYSIIWRGLLLGIALTSISGVYSQTSVYFFGLQAITALATLSWLVFTPTGEIAVFLRGLRPLALPAALFMGLMTLSALFASDVGLGLSQAGMWVSYLLLFFLAAALLSEEPWLERTVRFLLLVGLMLGGIAVYFYWGEVGRDFQPVMNSAFGNKNHFAGFLGLLIPPALALYLTANGWRQALAYGSSALFLSTCLFLTYSRGGYLSLAPALVLVAALLRHLPRRRLLLRPLLLVLLIVTTIPLIQGASLGHALGRGSAAVISVAEAAAGSPASDTLAPRLDYWQGALRTMADNPLLGTGPGSFRHVFSQYQQDPRYYSKFAHSFPLQTAAEGGLFAALAALWFLGALGWVSWRHLRRSRNRALHYALMVGLAGGMLANVLHNLVELDWYVPALANIFWIEAGLVAGSWARSQPRTPSTTPFGNRWVRPLSLLAALLFLVWTGLQVGEQLLLQHAADLRASAEATAAMETILWAERLNPWDGEAPFQLGDLYLVRFESEGRPEDLERGIAAAQRAVSLGTNNPSRRSLLARLYLAGNNRERPLLSEAAAQLEAIVARRRAFEVPLAYQRLGQAYLEMERWDEAERVYLRLLAGFPQGLDSLQPQYGALPKDELAPLLTEAHLALGNLSLQKGEEWRAEAEYRVALELEPKNAPAHFNLGLIYYRQERWWEALPHLEDAVHLAPQYAPAAYFAGLVYLKLGQDQNARASFVEALRRDPSFSPAQEQLATLNKDGALDNPQAER